MPKYELPPEKILIIRDISKGRPVKIEAWRYWSIAEDLGWRGITRQEACDAAKWAGRAKSGEEYSIGKKLKLLVK